MRRFRFLNNDPPIIPPTATTTPPIISIKVVSGISKPKIEKLEAVGCSVAAAVVVGAIGLDADVDVAIEEVGGVDVAENAAVVEVVEGEVTVEVELREMVVEVIGAETVPVVPMITTEDG